MSNDNGHRIVLQQLCYLWLLAGLLCSCARGVEKAPPGGPPDTTAPAIVSSFPGNGTVRVRTDEITIEFSEWMQESGLQNEVIITPIPDSQPEFDWSGRTLTLEFDQPLPEGRTYVLTFGAGISDLQGNRLGIPYTLTFSTGDKIDSGIVRGQVLDVARRDAFVFAWRIPDGDTTFADTLDPSLTRPDFIAPVADNGTFALQALPPGLFRLMAITDEYRNRVFDAGADAFGISPDDVFIDERYTPVGGISMRLRAAPDDRAIPTIYGATSINTRRTEIRFSEPIDTSLVRVENFELIAPTGTIEISTAWQSAISKTAILLAHQELTPGEEITARMRNLRDTAGNVLPDSSASITFTATATPDTLPPSLLPLGVDTTRPYSFSDSLVIAFDEAVQLTDARGVAFVADTSGNRVGLRLRRVSPAAFVARPVDTLTGVREGMIEIRLDRFVDMIGNRVDSTAVVPIRLAPLRQTGTMQGSIVDSTAPDAAHVLVARHVATGREFRLANLPNGPWELAGVPEGEYEVFAFVDLNRDTKYDYGSMTPYRPAEPFVRWNGTVRVRPRWVTNEVNLRF